MSDDIPVPDEDFDEEACHEEGEEVYRHVTDTDSPAGSSCTWVSRWNGGHWVLSDSMDPSGPYASIEDAVRRSGISVLVPDVAHEVTCESLSVDAIRALVESAQSGDEGSATGAIVVINGVRHLVGEGGGLAAT
jgi:hypothetical protein